MNNIEIIFYLKDCAEGTISTEVSMEDFCEKDEDGNFYYEVEGEKFQFKSADTLSKVLYEGIIDTLDKFHEAKLNGGIITNEKIETVFGFGDILVPIESVVGVKVITKHNEEFSKEDLVTVEMEDN